MFFQCVCFSGFLHGIWANLFSLTYHAQCITTLSLVHLHLGSPPAHFPRFLCLFAWMYGAFLKALSSFLRFEAGFTYGRDYRQKFFLWGNAKFMGACFLLYLSCDTRGNANINWLPPFFGVLTLCGGYFRFPQSLSYVFSIIVLFSCWAFSR